MGRCCLLSWPRRGVQPLDLGAVPDDEEAIQDAISMAISRCDALITSGGVSVGDYDYVKLVMDRLGAVRSMQVAIKPARPFTFGFIGGTPVFGLPGQSGRLPCQLRALRQTSPAADDGSPG